MIEPSSPATIRHAYRYSGLGAIPYLPVSLALSANLLGALATAGPDRPTSRAEVKRFRIGLEHELRKAFTPTKSGVNADARLRIAPDGRWMRLHSIDTTVTIAQSREHDPRYVPAFAVYLAELYAGSREHREWLGELQFSKGAGRLMPDVQKGPLPRAIAFARHRFATELPDHDGLVEACYDANRRLFDGAPIDVSSLPVLNGELE